MNTTTTYNPSWGRIGVLMGGCSSERKISLKSGQAIFNALKSFSCEVTAIDLVNDDENHIKDSLKNNNIDIAFIALHGKLGEDGKIQSILESEDINIPYTGSGINASKTAINKISTQKLFKDNNLPIAKFLPITINAKPSIEDIINYFNKQFPLVIKPACEGSSIGVSLIKSEHELNSHLNETSNDCLIEEYIPGRELTVGIVGKETLPIVEILSKNSFFDFNAKYESNNTEYKVPANISKDIAKKLSSLALKAHTILDCKDFSRTDFILDKNQKPYILEVNTIPGFTKTSLLPKAAKEKGINFNQLCLKLINYAYAKKKN